MELLTRRSFLYRIQGDKMKSFCVLLPIAFLLTFSIHCPASSIEHLAYQFKVSEELTDHKGSVNSVVFSPDGYLIASGSADSTVKLWDADSGKRIRAIMRHPFPISCVAFSPDSNIIAAGSEAGTITLWDVNYKERIKTLKGQEGAVCSIQFSHDGSFLISGSADSVIRLWDMRSGKEALKLSGHTDSINSLALSPDGKQLASASTDGSVKIWDISSGNNTLTLKEGAGTVNSVCFSPDGKTVAFGAASGVIRLWNAESGEEIGTFSGHKDAVGCMSFSPDGNILLSGSADANMLVWDVSSGNVMEELKTHTAAVSSIAFSSDGKRMVSAGADSVAKLWEITVKESLEIALKAEYEGWQRGILELKTDILGMPDVVRFQYSLDGSAWLDIVEKQEPPYSVDWNTRSSIPDSAETVSLRVVAERVTGITAINMAEGIFSVDNAPPKTKHDYDELWHTTDFHINLSADDVGGAGVHDVEYRLNNGQSKSTKWDGQPEITEEGTNILEYWSADRLGNEEAHKVLSSVNLDKTAPTFFSWAKEPENLLSEDATGILRVSAQVMDEGGSGLAGKIPQFDYHIGSETAYDGYEDMSRGDDNAWSYDIPEPSEGWNHYNGKSIYYRAICADAAGNTGQSAERQELIGSSKVPPTVKISTTFKKWERGILTLKAEASDADGAVKNVEFGYSFDGVSWKPIGVSDAHPYSVEWDTATAIPEAQKSVWVRATVTDNDGFSARFAAGKFGIDNQPPITDHDYDGRWHKINFSVNLTARDGAGSGALGVRYRLNGGGEKSVSSDGQPIINGQGKNTLEYWSVDAAGNEEGRKVLSDIKLDRLSPFFGTWDVKQDDSILHVEVKIADVDSGIKDAPQFVCHVGSDTSYTNYEEMRKTGEDGWKYDMDISSYLPDAIGKRAFFKMSARDAVGNLAIKMWEHEITGEIKKPTGETGEAVSETVAEEPDVSPIPVVEIRGKGCSIVWDVEASGTVKVGKKVDIKGHLKPKMGRSVPLKVTAIAPDNIISASQIDTDSQGAFQFALPLTSSGEWRVLANWRGDDEYEAAKSHALTFQVISEKSDSPKKSQKAGRFLKKNTMIIGLVFLYIIMIRLYRS